MKVNFPHVDLHCKGLTIVDSFEVSFHPLELTSSYVTCATSPTAARAVWLVASAAVIVVTTTAISPGAAAALRVGIVAGSTDFTGEVHRCGRLGGRERVGAAHDDVCRLHRLVCVLWLAW